MSNFNEIGSPMGEYYVYVSHGNSCYLIGGYSKLKAMVIKGQLRCERKNAFISTNPELGCSVPGQCSLLAGQSAIKRIPGGMRGIWRRS